MKKINIQQKEDKESYEVGSAMFLSLKFKLLCIFISYFSEVFTWAFTPDTKLGYH